MPRDKPLSELKGALAPETPSPPPEKTEKPSKKKNPPVKTTYRDPQTGEIKVLGEE